MSINICVLSRIYITSAHSYKHVCVYVLSLFESMSIFIYITHAHTRVCLDYASTYVSFLSYILHMHIYVYVCVCVCFFASFILEGWEM